MSCQLISEEFGPNIQHIAGVHSIVSDTLSILPSKTIDQENPRTTTALSRSNDLFTTRPEQTVEDG